MKQHSPHCLDLLRCAQPECNGILTSMGSGPPLAKCRSCDALYPILGEVAIAVSRVPAYMAMYRDAVLASLAERGLATPDAVATVEAFAHASAWVKKDCFSDDWTTVELERESKVYPQPMSDTELVSLVATAHDNGIVPSVLGMLEGSRLQTVLELGCGAGLLSENLAPLCHRLVVSDLSLRAVLHAKARAANSNSEVGSAVLDAEDLSLAPAKLSAIVAANLVDLLDDPLSFAQSCSHGLRPGGRLVLTTPNPGLDTGDDNELCRVIEQSGLEVAHVKDGVTWLRAHGPRHFQVYLCQVVCAIKPKGR